MTNPSLEELQVTRLGEPHHSSPIGDRYSFVHERGRILVSACVEDVEDQTRRGEQPASFEPAGAREFTYFPCGPETRVGIVTCGGLCPGLNDVIRSVVLCAWNHYGVREIYGFRYGFAGLSASPPAEAIRLNPEIVDRIHGESGTMLGSSRGPQNTDEMVETLQRLGINILFTIGGDGTLRGASLLARRLLERGCETAVVGIPKTIDNDIHFVARSFGFSTAVEEATRSIRAAHTEARGAFNGVGLVKLMGRHSGFIAATATLANSDVNFCLVPEFPVALDGPKGFLEALRRHLQRTRHAVVLVAEGFGQELLQDPQQVTHDASGNVKLGDIGTYMVDRIKTHFAACEEPLTIKYIDPSYTIRALPAGALDSELCLRLGQNAVHAGMAGRTDIMIGFWNMAMTHVPLAVATALRRQLTNRNPTWVRVLETTDQAELFTPGTPTGTSI